MATMNQVEARMTPAEVERGLRTATAPFYSLASPVILSSILL
jgi:hypothetical protein